MDARDALGRNRTSRTAPFSSRTASAFVSANRKAMRSRAIPTSCSCTRGAADQKDAHCVNASTPIKRLMHLHDRSARRRRNVRLGIFCRSAALCDGADRSRGLPTVRTDRCRSRGESSPCGVVAVAVVRSCAAPVHTAPAAAATSAPTASPLWRAGRTVRRGECVACSFSSATADVALYFRQR